MHRDMMHCRVWAGGVLAAAMLLGTQAVRADDASLSVHTAQQTIELEQPVASSEVPVQEVGFGLHYGRYGYGRFGYGRFYGGYRPYYSSRFYRGYGYPYGRYSSFYRPWYGYASYYRPYYYRSAFYRPWYAYAPSYYASRPYYGYYSYAPIGYSYYAPAYYAPTLYAPTYNYAPSSCYYGTCGLGCVY